MCFHACKRHGSRKGKIVDIFCNCKKCKICGDRIDKDLFGLHIEVCHTKVKSPPVRKRYHWLIMPKEDPLAA